MSESETWVLVTTYYQLQSEKAIPKSGGLIVLTFNKATLSVRFPVKSMHACIAVS